MKTHLLAPLCFSLLLSTTAHATVDILITEVIPAVSTDSTAGDTVELYNNGDENVDLTDWILSDLDPASAETSLLNEATFAPGSLSLPVLAPGEFAVVVFADTNGTASYADANYGLYIVAPLATVGASFLDRSFEQVLLANAAGTPQDFVAWHVTDSSPSASTLTDMTEDLSSVTPPTSDYSFTIGNAAWTGADAITTELDYAAATVDFTGLDGVSTYGNGVLRRISSNGVFSVGTPDGPAQWEAVPRHQGTLGNASDYVTTVDGIQPLLATGSLTAYLDDLDSTNAPQRRIARDEDQSPADFAVPLPADLTDWEGVLALALAEDWEGCFDAADALGYEVVEFLDTVSGKNFHILQEQTVPGEAGFTGQGTYVFGNDTGTRGYLVLEIPHPRWDTNTDSQGALAIPQVLPRVTLFAGANRNNHLTPSTCDGTHSNGSDYRISDVAHHPGSFFHTTHKYLDGTLATPLFIQFHGFCCPGSGTYATVTDDVILSNGYNASPGVNDLTEIWEARIEAQNFLADGSDLSTAAVYPADTTFLGATTNLQGRVTNGVTIGLECDTPATGATGRFIHIEQDPDVREEPQHIITALIEALDILEAVPVELDQYMVD
ncbi:MAG: hypothetical protein PWP23_744 [Candidatus Sumerlaeota bacterium]|nr:hypothetical protein [Candidatus Sumerlaeota bacterium]